MTFGTITTSTVSFILIIIVAILIFGGLITIVFSVDSGSSAGLVGLMLIIIATFISTFASSLLGNETTKQNNKNIENAIKDNFKDAKILNNDKERWEKGFFVSQEKTYTFEITNYDILLIKYDDTDVMRISGNDY